MKLPDSIDKVRGSIVQIRRSVEGDDLGRPIGTGFILAEKPYRVVTAKHVTDAIRAQDRLRVAFAGPSVRTPEVTIEGTFMGAPARVLDTDSENDLALVEVAPDFTTEGVTVGPATVPFGTHPFVLSAETPREGAPLAVAGYPLAQPSLVTNSGILASRFSPDGTPGKWADRLLGDFTANPGNSGGPVFEAETGHLVGVCVAGRLAPVVGAAGMVSAGLTVIVPIEKVTQLLERNGVDLSLRSAQRSTPPAGRSKNARRRR